MAQEQGVAIGLGFGSNIGDRPANIWMAIARLEAEGICTIDKISSLYRTKPWGLTDQEDFANACVLARTRLAPEALLAHMKRIEIEMGREPAIRWGPRLIDIDILFYDDLVLRTPGLVLPHKDLFERAFVLVPLAEISPDLSIAGRAIGEAAARLDKAAIAKWTEGS